MLHRMSLSAKVSYGAASSRPSQVPTATESKLKQNPDAGMKLALRIARNSIVGCLALIGGL